MLSAIATLLVLAGILLLIVGYFGFLIAAFSESVLWGLGVLFIGIITPVFAIVHWNRAKGPVTLFLYGFGCVFAAVLLANNHLPWPLH